MGEQLKPESEGLQKLPEGKGEINKTKYQRIIYKGVVYFADEDGRLLKEQSEKLEEQPKLGSDYFFRQFLIKKGKELASQIKHKFESINADNMNTEGLDWGDEEAALLIAYSKIHSRYTELYYKLKTAHIQQLNSDS